MRKSYLADQGAAISLFPEDRCIHHFFEEQALMRPDAIALHDRDQSISYRQLNQRANQVAHYILSLKLPPESIIAVLFDRSTAMIACFLGILKSGNAFLPIDPEYPISRCEYMVKDSGAVLLFTQKEYTQMIVRATSSLPCDVVTLDSSSLTTMSSLNPQHDLSSRDLAFVIYTSGSTGKPKGVLHEHRGICNLNQAKRQTCYIHEKSVLLLSSAIGFDAAVWEWTSALMGGSQLVLESKANLLPGQSLLDTLLRYKVTVLLMCPTALTELPHFISDHLEVILSGGEPCPESLVSKWAGHYTFLNLYGPSECCVCSTAYVCTLRDIAKTVSIGSAIANTFTYILDSNLEPVQPGQKGELYIGGCGVARGYINRPDETKKRFLDNPFLDPSHGYKKMYKTGDLVREREDGNLEYLGRADNQVKLRGFRIELEEVESKIALHPQVIQVVCQIEDHRGQKVLSATLSVTDQNNFSLLELRQFLPQHLLEQSIPANYFITESFQLTPHGKIDRSLVKDLERRLLQIESVGEPDNYSVMEAKLLPLWKKTLALDSVDKDVPFYHLGGHSLMVLTMVTEINHCTQASITAADFLQHSSLSQMASFLEGNVSALDCSVDTVLPDSIQPLCADKNITDPKVILLTGVTGFLGAHLLSDLCAMTDAKVICFVRAESIAAAKDKLKHNLARYGFEKLLLGRRIVVVLADLAKPLCGLSSEEFDFWCQSVDAIYHNGAFVHHLYDYQTLKSANVDSTLELLKMATTHKDKAFYFISTAAVMSVIDDDGYMLEQLPGEQAKPPAGGYPQSKWVSERLLQQASERGMQVKVFRPGSIMGQSQTGACAPEDNHVLSLIKGCMQLQAAPDWDFPLNILPVDFVSMAIVLLSLHDDRDEVVHNIVNKQVLSWRELVRWVNDHCSEIALMPEVTWREQKLPLVTESNALYRLLPQYQHASRVEAAEDKLRLDKIRLEKTEKTLVDMGLTYPLINRRQLGCYFDYLKRSGFIRLS